jgi:predicted nuclease with TOPRIM domain
MRNVLSATLIHMEQARTNWNDDRLDRLADQVCAMRQHIDDRFDAQNARLDERFARMDERFGRIDKRFDALQYAMIVTLASFLATIAAAQF